MKDYEAKEEAVELMHDNDDLINIKAYELVFDVLMDDKGFYTFY